LNTIDRTTAVSIKDALDLMVAYNLTEMEMSGCKFKREPNAKEIAVPEGEVKPEKPPTDEEILMNPYTKM